MKKIKTLRRTISVNKMKLDKSRIIKVKPPKPDKK